MIQLEETHYAYGTRAHVTGLKTANVRIYPGKAPTRHVGEKRRATWGEYIVRTSRRSQGSIRYSEFASYNEAVDYALAYAGRIAKQKNEKEA